MNRKRSLKLASGWMFIGLILAVLAIAAIYWASVDASSMDSSERGEFGDKFGGLNALFTALAFAGVIFTVLLQRDELSLQRRELRGQRKQLREQNRTFRLQSFEDTFFQLLRLHHQIVEALDVVRGSSDPLKGREAFEEFYKSVRRRYVVDLRDKHVDKRSHDELDGLDEVYLAEYQKRQADFGHYFRNLYHTLKLVQNSDAIPESRGYTYAGFVRAQLSTYELLCLFYNCLSQQGANKFKPLAEKYALFKNLPTSLLLHEHHIAFYEASAFGFDRREH